MNYIIVFVIIMVIIGIVTLSITESTKKIPDAPPDIAKSLIPQQPGEKPEVETDPEKVLKRFGIHDLKPIEFTHDEKVKLARDLINDQVIRKRYRAMESSINKTFFEEMPYSFLSAWIGWERMKSEVKTPMIAWLSPEGSEKQVKYYWLHSPVAERVWRVKCIEMSLGYYTDIEYRRSIMVRAIKDGYGHFFKQWLKEL